MSAENVQAAVKAIDEVVQNVEKVLSETASGKVAFIGYKNRAEELKQHLASVEGIFEPIEEPVVEDPREEGENPRGE